MPRLAIPRLSFGWLGAFANRTLWLYVAYTATLFVAFLVITFPHELIIRQATHVLSGGPVTMEFSSAGLGLRGYEIAGIKLVPTGSDPPVPVLEISRLSVRPAFSQWIRGNFSALSISGDLYGGQLDGQVIVSQGAVSGNFSWSDLALGKYRTLAANLEEGQINGKVSGQLTFEAKGAGFAQGGGSGDIRIDGGGLSHAKIQGFAVPDVKLKETRTKFKIGTGRLELQDTVANGDLNIQGSGQIVLKDPVGESVLSLRATITATPETPDALKGALMLIPRPAGAKPDTPLTITGTLSKPKLR